LDGVLDFLNSKKMTDAGALDLIDDEDSDVKEGIDQQTRGNLGLGLPGSMENCGRPIARTKCVNFAPTGRSFAAATTDGVSLYSMNHLFLIQHTLTLMSHLRYLLHALLVMYCLLTLY
jgi:periodic tryptophan protein 2